MYMYMYMHAHMHVQCMAVLGNDGMRMSSVFSTALHVCV